MIFAVGLYFLSRKSLNTTVASALMMTAINLVLVVVILLFALPYINPPTWLTCRFPSSTGNLSTPPS